MKTRSDGKLFNLSRLKASSKTRELCVRELLYADNSALVATNHQDIQEIMDGFSAAATLFGLKINVSKTELLYQPPPDEPFECQEVLVNGDALKKSSHFTYLGSAVTDTNSADLEVERRTQATAKAFGSLQKRLWSQLDIKRKTKVKVCNVAILPSLLYSVESMTLYQRHIKRLTRSQIHHLLQIHGIRWQDRVPDVEVLRRAETPSVQPLITASQLRWAGHVRQMPDSRLPKAVLYGKLSEGKRKQGGQKLRFKDVLKRHMKNANVKSETWEQDALDKRFWRATVKQAEKSIEEKRQLEYQRAHERRHSTATSGHTCSRCNKI